MSIPSAPTPALTHQPLRGLVLILGATLPALLAGSGTRRLVVVLALVGVPLVLLAAYLVPRWLTLPRAQSVSDWVVPVLRPWARVLGLVLPARAASRPTDLRSIWREGAAVGLRADDELVMVGGVMAFSVRPVREVMTPRTDLVAVEEHADLADIRMVFAQSGYSRIPVYRGTLDEIVGMLHAFDLFKLRPGALSSDEDEEKEEAAAGGAPTHRPGTA